MTRDADTGGVTRQAVLDCIVEKFGENHWTTRDLVLHLAGADERAVRGAVTWLMCGGRVKPVGQVSRRDRENRPYTAMMYRWTGRREIRRVSRDMIGRMDHAQDSLRELRAYWLARKWR